MAMVLDHQPPPSPADVELRRVETFTDSVAMWEVIFEGFGMPDEERVVVRATLRERWVATADDPSRWSYLAIIEGVPVAEGSVRRTVHGPLWLAGGVTLPAFRGRGIYRALVRARWDDAVRPGAGALVVNAMVDTSYPILDARVPRGGEDPVAGRPEARRSRKCLGANLSPNQVHGNRARGPRVVSAYGSRGRGSRHIVRAIGAPGSISQRSRTSKPKPR